MLAFNTKESRRKEKKGDLGRGLQKKCWVQCKSSKT
jgi:hypothetical protein